MARYAISAIGQDRPGIVAAVAEALVRHGANVEDSQMRILGGHFAMMLLVEAPDEAALREDLEHVAAAQGLAAVSISPVAGGSDAAAPTHLVTVYGSDHPGIVHAFATRLAALGVNITDLQTQLGGAVYVMLLEVAVPAGVSLGDELAAVAAEQGVEVKVRELDADAL
jgi:glycine cleavage system transcriptional repressor